MIKILDFINKNADWQYKLSCHPYHISTKWDGIYFILKYDQVESDFAKEIVRQCRGSIFKYEMGVYSCVCMPFYKFGNYGESYVTPLNWNNSYVTEKLDGSLIKLWFDNDEWHWSTNSTIDAEKAPLNNNKFKNYFQLIEYAVDNDFSFLRELNKNVCYMFELTSPYNKVVIGYKDTRLNLIGARNMENLEEYDIHFLSKLYDNVFRERKGFGFPKRYAWTSLDDCITFTSKMSSDEEGVVAVDDNFNRMKIKSKEWLKAAKLKNNGVVTCYRIIEMMRNDTLDDFRAYCPEHNDFVDEILAKYHKLKETLTREEFWFESSDARTWQKPYLAEQIKGLQPFIKGFLFKKYDENISVDSFLESMPIKKLKELLEE